MKLSQWRLPFQLLKYEITSWHLCHVARAFFMLTFVLDVTDTRFIIPLGYVQELTEKTWYFGFLMIGFIRKSKVITKTDFSNKFLIGMSLTNSTCNTSVWIVSSSCILASAVMLFSVISWIWLRCASAFCSDCVVLTCSSCRAACSSPICFSKSVILVFSAWSLWSSSAVFVCSVSRHVLSSVTLDLSAWRLESSSAILSPSVPA